MRIISSVAILLFTVIGMADEQVSCSLKGQTRTVTLTYENPNAVLPCEVNYQKPTGTQLLWKASNEAGFCERKMAEFIEKQRSWGWSCSELPVDDNKNTGKLAPPSVNDSDDLLEGIDLENP